MLEALTLIEDADVWVTLTDAANAAESISDAVDILFAMADAEKAAEFVSDEMTIFCAVADMEKEEDCSVSACRVANTYPWST